MLVLAGRLRFHRTNPPGHDNPLTAIGQFVSHLSGVVVDRICLTDNAVPRVAMDIMETITLPDVTRVAILFSLS
jgi:hypothetical protein